MSKRTKNKADCRADTRGKPWAGVPHVVLESEAYRTLKPIERSVLLEIVRKMNGYNNGEIGIGYAELAHRLNRKNQAPFKSAIAELWRRGLIEPGVLKPWKERQPRTYRLTFVNTIANNKFVAATNDYLSWRPDKENVATDAVAEQPQTVTPFVAERIAAATNGVATDNGKPPFLSNEPATDGVVLIDSHSLARRSGSKTTATEGQISGGDFRTDETRAPSIRKSAA